MNSRQGELEDKQRTSDAYILSRVEFPPDHLFRVLRENILAHLTIKPGEVPIPDFEPIQTEVVGFAWRDDLLNAGVRNSIDGQEVQPSYCLRTGELRRSNSEWQKLVDRL